MTGDKRELRACLLGRSGEDVNPIRGLLAGIKEFTVKVDACSNLHDVLNEGMLRELETIIVVVPGSPEDETLVETIVAGRGSVPVIVIATSCTDRFETAVSRAGARDCVRGDEVNVRTLTRVLRAALDHRSVIQQCESIENALKRNETILKTAQELAHIGGWEYEVDTRIMTWTEEVYKIHEMPVDASIDHVQRSLQCYLPGDRETILVAFERCINEGVGYDLQFPFLTCMNHARWIRTIARAVFEAGKIRRVVGNIIDITDQQNAEEEIRVRSLLLDAAIDSVFVHDEGGNFFYVNEAAWKTRGYTREELMAMNLHQLDSPSDAELIEPRIEFLKSRNTFTFETQHVCKNGTTIPVEVHAGRITIQGKDLVFSICRDISERKRAEEDIRASEAFTRAVLDNLPIGIAVNSSSPPVEFKYMNDNFPRIYRTTRQAIMDPDSFWTAVYGDTPAMDAIKQRVLADVATGDPARMRWDDVPIARAGGPTTYVSAKNILIPGQDLLISTVWDTTDRKVAEEKLRDSLDALKRSEAMLVKLNADLEARVEERTRSLRDAQEKMIRQERLATIGKLAGSMSHELRNPLGAISNSAYLLAMKVSGVDEKIAKHVSIIREEADRAASIINSLLDHARVKVDEAKDVNINVLLDRTLASVTPGAGIEVEKRYVADLPVLRLDELRVIQVFTNLITNAFQAMPGGGKLTLSTAVEGGHVAVVITDTGTGIAPEHMTKLFEPLFSTKTRGIGLGLTITKEILDAFGGTVDVQSTVGVGTTFTVRLPVT